MHYGLEGSGNQYGPELRHITQCWPRICLAGTNISAQRVQKQHRPVRPQFCVLANSFT